MKKDWTYKKLGEVCETTSGGTPSKSKMEYYENGDIPWLRSGELSNGEIYSTELCITQKGLDNSSAKIIPAGTVSIAMYGATVGEVGIIKKPMCTNQAICNILPNEQFIPNFIRYVLVAYKPKFISLATGGAQPNISQNIIKNTSIPIPPLAIQRSIVAELDLLHSVISKKKEQLRALDNLAQSLFYQMFGDPITNPMGWEVKKLGEVVAEDCSLSYGIVQPGDHVENGIPVVRPIDLIDTYVYRKGLKCTSAEIASAYKRTVLKGNELLMCVRGTTGVISIASSELVGCNTTRGITPIALDEKVSQWFVYHLIKMSSYQQLIASLTYGIALKQINMKDVRTLPIILPPLSLQQSFAAKVSAIEAQKRFISQSIKDVESLLAQRMDHYFG